MEPFQLPHVRNEEILNSLCVWFGSSTYYVYGFPQNVYPPRSTIATYVTSIYHAAYHLEECYQAEEDDSLSLSITSPSISTTRPPIISDLDKISVLLNGLPPVY